jgi:hypothetical protein
MGIPPATLAGVLPRGIFPTAAWLRGVQGEGTCLSMDHGINLFCSGARRLNYDYNNRHIILTPVYAPFLLWIFFGRPRLMTPFKQTPVKFGLPSSLENVFSNRRCFLYALLEQNDIVNVL